MGDVFDDVWMRRDVGVDGNLDEELFGTETAGAEGVVFVDEFDGDDGAGRVWWNGFTDRGICAGAYGFRYDAEGEVRG